MAVKTIQNNDKLGTVTVLAADTRPTFDLDAVGRKLIETDTGNEYKWTGAIWVQTHVAGRLRSGAA